MSTIDQADKAFQEALCLAGGILAMADMMTETSSDSMRLEKALYGIVAMVKGIELSLCTIDLFLEKQRGSGNSEQA